MTDEAHVSLVPIARWARSYRRADLRYDLVAGVTVSALVVPKALGYAGIAGVPIENGLYAAAAGCLLYAVFGTSRQISTGPSSALAAIAASAAGDQRCRPSGSRPRSWSPPSPCSPGCCSSAPPCSAGLALAAAVQGGDHRLPVRRGDRCRHRRAPQADRHDARRHEQLAGVRQLAAGRSAISTGRRSSSGSSRWPSS